MLPSELIGTRKAAAQMWDRDRTGYLSAPQMPSNVADLLVTRARQSPHVAFGTVEDPTELGHAIDLASRVAASLGESGLVRGACAMLIGPTTTTYLVAWAALQLAGVQAAMVNPDYPSPLLAEMARDLDPDAVVWVGSEVDREIAAHLPHYDLTAVHKGSMSRDDTAVDLATVYDELPGLAARSSDITSFMHTSGTSGAPKFCAQSHEYMLRLGRFIADELGFTRYDTVFAPLPMFHINPLGYGVVASLLAGASVLGAEKFSASRFWPTVVDFGVTAAVLHIPPVAILKRATTREDSVGHRLRVVFTGDPEFLEQFDVPLGVSAYGSTEAGGLCHTWTWRQYDCGGPVEGMTHLAGRARHDVEWRLSDDGEIQVRDRGGRALFAGYRRSGDIQIATDGDGWFSTGDIGRIDEWGNLVFVERMSESIRVKGEYVPISFVEERLAAVEGIADFALWRRQSALADQEVVMYVGSQLESLPLDGIRAAFDSLPAFMRPVELIEVDLIPRDTGVGKVQRRRLADLPVTRRIAF